MKRRFSPNRFDGGDAFARAPANPLEGLANLVDVMLVFACGLMLALVINWNVDIAAKNAENEARSEEMTQLSDVSGGEGTALDDDTAYEKLDVVVYRDPATGKLYMVENGG
ncbi:MAG: DUF2149 domain-containing protein [Clostridiales Family XIII bacterium]|jgi:hypothetical protein|nr:DUF2149 domain-containing protein [Clostridiales Family XIII bacterium]